MKLFLFIGILLLLDVGAGIQGFRKYLISENKAFYIPYDLYMELFAGAALCYLYLWSIISFKPINERNSRNT